jgi:hypothetical protein
MEPIDMQAETDNALKDAYWGEVRKLYDAYLHAVSIADVKPTQVEAASERFKKGLLQAQTALNVCRGLSEDVPQAVHDVQTPPLG